MTSTGTVKIEIPRVAAADLSPEQQKDLSYIFTTALEGGIGYWSKALGGTYKWDCDFADQGVELFVTEYDQDDAREAFHAAGHETRDARLSDWDGQEFDAVVVRLTPAMMLGGLYWIVEHRPLWRTQCGGTYLTLLLSILDERADTEDYDSIDADTIAQAALGFVQQYKEDWMVLFG